MLILGCGNRERGDDAAGILVAEKLQQLGIQAELCPGEATSLVEAWAGIEDVVLVDAVMTGAPVGTIQTWDGRRPLASIPTRNSTHGLGVIEAIELARVLHRLPRRLRVLGIEGRRFEPGTAISPEVDSAVEEVVCRVVQEANAGQTGSPAR